MLVGLGGACSAPWEEISKDLGQGSLGPLLSYHFLGASCVLGALQRLSNLKFTPASVYRPIWQRQELGQTEAGHWAGHREGRLWPLYRCRRRLRDTQVFRALELQLESEGRPSVSKFLLFLLLLCCHRVCLSLSFPICAVGSGDWVR